MEIFGKSHVGMVRQANEDSFITKDLDGLYIGVVCDGMGGAAGGSTASKAAGEEFINAVLEEIKNITDENLYEEALRKGVECANKRVYDIAQNTPELSGMGTTLCAVLIKDGKLWAVSVGDSRLYMFSGNEVVQISKDHSYVQTLVDSGAITKEEALTHPNKNIITKAVGTKEDIDCDTFLMDFTMDGLLICSDGLSNYVHDDELNELFLQYNTVEELASALIDRANELGGGDNITVIVVKK